MSRLKTIIAEIQQLEDGTWYNDETGEITELKPTSTDGVQWSERVENAQTLYPSNNYQNQWGKVSPFNIIMTDMIGQLYNMGSGAAIANVVCEFIESLNSQFGPMDKTYDYVSQDYLKELRYNLEKCKKPEKAIEYLTNVYFQGMGMGTGRGKRKKGSVTVESLFARIDLNNKENVKRALVALKAYVELTEKRK